MSPSVPVIRVICPKVTFGGWNRAAMRVRAFTAVTLPTIERSVGSCA